MARALAFAAFLLLVTALLLPWWVVSYRTEGGPVYDREGVRPFGHGTASADTAPRVAAGLLVAGACALLFVRLAGGSDQHEPRLWRRDLLVTASLAAAALLATGLWPRGGIRFWGGRTFESAGNVTVQRFSESSNPGLGWWLVLAAIGLLAIAWLRARPAERESLPA